METIIYCAISISLTIPAVALWLEARTRIAARAEAVNYLIDEVSHDQAA